MKNPLEELQAIIDRVTASKESLKVLEAGCGSLSNITLRSNVYVVGLDVSAEQLARNRSVHQKIVADLETHTLPDSEYDLIICWDVLEHLGRPLAVLRKFFKAIKQDGIIVLAFPNVLSLKGLIAKYTPFRFHTLISRWIYGDRVGSPGYEVCPTILRYAIAPSAVARYAVRYGCDVTFTAVFESGMQKRVRERFGLVKTRWWLVRFLVRLSTFGWVDAEGSDCIIVLHRSVNSIGLRPILHKRIMTAPALRSAKTPREIATAISSIAARTTLGLIYSLTLLLCRLTPRARRWPTGVPSCIAVTGTFYNLGWFRAHVVPLVRCGVRAVIVVCDRPLRELENVRFACPPRWLLSVSGRALAKLLWLVITAIRRRPDLFIGYHIFPGAVTALIAARLFGRPACYQMTGGPVEVVGGGWLAENPLMARLARPSVVVEHLAIAVIRQFDLVVVRGSKAKAFLARHGIDESVAIITGSITACSTVPPARRQYDLVFVGRLTEIKRPLMFVEIVARVKRQCPSLRAAVVGTGPLLSAMQQRSSELNIDDSITFCGQRLDVPAIVARTRVFVLTSRSEGFSIAMAEAMGAGAVPVVADVGELRDLVVNGESGYVVSPDDLEAYVARILHVLRDSDLFDRLSTCAAKTAMSRAATEVIAAHWTDHLVALSRRSGSSGVVARRGERRHPVLDSSTGSSDRHSSLRS